MRARLFLVLAALPLPTAGDAAPPHPLSETFAKGIVRIVHDELVYRPKAFSVASRIALRNPEKFSDQPEGTSRMAQWHFPSNSYGVTEVRLTDGGSGPTLSASMEMTLSGRPCMMLVSLERALKRKAHFGGAVMTMALNGPAPQLEELGETYADISSRSRFGRWVAVSTRSSKPRRQGCIRTLTLNLDRPAGGRATASPVR